MKMIKFALLGTAALAAVTVSARANELSDLKAQIEALNARFDAQAAVPAGYQLLQVGMVDAIVVPSVDVDATSAKKVRGLMVVPAADMPASTTVTWTGNVKVGLGYHNYTSTSSDSSSYTDVMAKFGLTVAGVTETAVGEVGVKISFAGNANGGIGGWNKYYNSVVQDGFSGWWKITPELSLVAGHMGSLSGNDEGFDGKKTNHFYEGDANGGFGTGDFAQMRLAYSSGPISAAIALEDGDNTGSDLSSFGVAGELKYSGDSFGVELNAGLQNTASVGWAEDTWTVNAGAHVAMDMFTLSAAAGMGSGTSTSDDYTKASLMAKVALSDSARIEAGVSHKWNTQYTDSTSDVTAFGVGIYYSPVSQLTIGLEAAYDSNDYYTHTDAGLVTVFSF